METCDNITAAWQAADTVSFNKKKKAADTV